MVLDGSGWFLDGLGWIGTYYYPYYIYFYAKRRPENLKITKKQ